jgi:ribose-phosphate pyrophosphokinase
MYSLFWTGLWMLTRLPVASQSSLGIALTPCQVSKFSALETSVQIHASVRDEDVFIIQSPSPPSINDHLMELLIMISGE